MGLTTPTPTSVSSNTLGLLPTSSTETATPTTQDFPGSDFTTSTASPTSDSSIAVSSTTIGGSQSGSLFTGTSETSIATGSSVSAVRTTQATQDILTTPTPQINGTTSLAQVSSESTNGTAVATTAGNPLSTASSISQTAWLPTVLITASATPTTTSPLLTAADTTAPAQPTNNPNVPKIVTPADGIPNAPENSTLVRIGFLEALNFPFVVQHSVTVAQIFQVLPIALAYALDVPLSSVVVRNLQPYAMSQYNATVAMVWIPQDLYDTLKVEILTANSPLYKQVNPTAQQLVNLIDPTIPLLADGSTVGSGSAGTTENTAGGNSNLANSGATGGSLDNVQAQDTSSSSSTVNPVVIGLGVAAAAAGYAALMFLGARHFRKQSAQSQADRRHHARVSSITGERAASPPFTQSYRSSGASSGRGVRGQNISAPLMTENSLLL